MGSLSFLLRCLSLAVFVCSCSYGFTSVRSGAFLNYKIPKQDYVTDKLALVHKVSFNFSTANGYPELPFWLHLEQRDVEKPAFIYGAPDYWDTNVTIEIIGWDKEDYSTERKEREIIVEPNQIEFPWHQAEFMIMNKNLDTFLDKNEHDTILEIVKNNYWDASDLVVTQVMSALSRGGRIPLPNSHKKEGVFVRVGSHESPGADSSLQTGQPPKIDYFVSGGHDYKIKWSNFSWLDLQKFPSPETLRQAMLPEDKIVATTEYTSREFDDSPRDFEIAFILVVVIPILIILIFVLLLSIIMCFGREGRKSRDQKTPNIQLTHHHNIQRSTLRLRELSKPAETDPSNAQSSDNTSRPRQGEYERVQDEHEDDGTDGRNAPPPYRMPPSAGTAGAQQV